MKLCETDYIIMYRKDYRSLKNLIKLNEIIEKRGVLNI